MSKWLDFLFTIVVRLICGVVLGSGAGMLLNYKGILWSFSKDNLKGPVIWLALCGLVGGVIAIFTFPVGRRLGIKEFEEGTIRAHHKLTGAEAYAFPLHPASFSSLPF